MLTEETALTTEQSEAAVELLRGILAAEYVSETAYEEGIALLAQIDAEEEAT